MSFSSIDGLPFWDEVWWIWHQIHRMKHMSHFYKGGGPLAPYDNSTGDRVSHSPFLSTLNISTLAHIEVLPCAERDMLSPWPCFYFSLTVNKGFLGFSPHNLLYVSCWWEGHLQLTRKQTAVGESTYSLALKSPISKSRERRGRLPRHGGNILMEISFCKRKFEIAKSKRSPYIVISEKKMFSYVKEKQTWTNVSPSSLSTLFKQRQNSGSCCFMITNLALHKHFLQQKNRGCSSLFRFHLSPWRISTSALDFEQGWPYKSP